jgi:hypothetical protein
MMDDLTPDQRGAIEALKAARGPCPSAETLVAYEALSAADRARHPAHDHIAICSRCQLVLLHAAAPATAPSSPLRWMLPLAALLLVGVAGVMLRGGGVPPSTGVETVRGSEIQALGPIGSVDAVGEFSWQSPIRAERYRVRVTRGADSVFYGETAALKIAASAELFEPGVEYRWSVEALDQDGDVRMTSPPQTFRIK